LTVKLCPPTEIVPVRCELFGFAAALKLMVAPPDPLVGPVSVIQLALSVAVQLQPAPAVSANDPVPPLAATV
jgi:hypothetical protein